MGITDHAEHELDLIAKAIRAYGWDALKTVAYYQRVLDKDVRDLYAGELDRDAFVDDMVRLIDEQFDRAWREGLRANGIEPKESKPEWDKVLDERKVQELDYVENFADDILGAKKEDTPIDPLRARVSLWANRYNEVVNLAQLTSGQDHKYKWIYGDTDHCSTCYTLNGVVAYGEDWAASGLHPQGAPNNRLECQGWHCQCRLEITDEPLTEPGIPNV